jgi:DNA mismatch endonuclease, patch repair protein
MTSEGRSKNMRAIRSKNTLPEIKVRRALFAAGLRFRLHERSLPGTPDIVLSSRRTLVDVRGCFWHQHSCRDGHVPKTGKHYWRPKLKRNVARDIENDKCLRELGWKVEVIWACEVDSQRLRRLVEKIKRRRPR